ncbi:carbohydrate ABC transporter permease [Oerskovia enterophila]|uniref:L-arabinose transport system permease protein AraQ n=1 Tax=Oerskovia enterophila TaxID=43678 RepID=A0A163PTA7_9CELL|nr:carbohydrate ABC transporter permease [Oerskovia enterophila]KZM33490.1 L-arabinose transport system permease protein AraQ [Oerskovia enterophila]
MSAVSTGRRQGRTPSRLASGRIPGDVSRRARPKPRHKRPSLLLGVLMTLMVLYCLVPLWWLVVNSTKTMDSLYGSFAFWFSGEFSLFQNIADTFTYQDGIFLRWLTNTLFYVVVGAGGATLLATLAGYGLAKYKFPGRKWVFAIILGAMAIPGTALAVPQFLLFSGLGLTNTPWSVIIPAMVSAFGLYLVWVYARDAIPDELLEAARLDGAGEIRIFFVIALRQLAPALITVLMFAVVATWNNYFLPLIMLSDAQWYPLPVGLAQWSAQSSSIGGQAIPHLVITGSLLTVIPISAAFLYLQRYWQSGLTAGSVK